MITGHALVAMEFTEIWRDAGISEKRSVWKLVFLAEACLIASTALLLGIWFNKIIPTLPLRILTVGLMSGYTLIVMYLSRGKKNEVRPVSI